MIITPKIASLDFREAYQVVVLSVVDEYVARFDVGVDIAILMEDHGCFKDTSCYILDLFPVEWFLNGCIQKILLEMSEDDRCWPGWVLNLINEMANVDTATLEALKDVPLVLDAGMAADALHNHELIALISDGLR